ncbi:hypothetical protein BCL57_001701 [Agromyces flavus]|uniref:Uncharacterized protein n=1 Tax=Agromyces flavus TaxID=589382 RepID=A0A1H1LFB1_9MICO|nr:hypothetical protein [Agromyces flavus]MCP2367547.1 hypothetical protein [Agromyces flavus]GGI45512.1 hypothetical protein GCM10010932_09920 [Agromyces flavus]SDR72992.1 hypothetical protein SAMN04489721_0114 [Agromyces flavus]
MAPHVEVRRLLLASAAVVSALLLAGCAPGPGPVENFPGLPVIDEEEVAAGDAEDTEQGGETEDETEEGSAEEVPEPTGDEPYVQYLQDGGRLAITIWGSSTCPIIPTELRVTAEAGEGNAVEAILPEAEEGPCTMDFVPHTTVFSTPADVTTTEELEVTVGDAVVTVPVK